MKKKLSFLVGIIVLFYLQILIFDNRILISETRIKAGQDIDVEEYGNLKNNVQDTLVCRYFNGRKLLNVVYWYAPNNFMGRDSCKLFIFSEDKK